MSEEPKCTAERERELRNLATQIAPMLPMDADEAARVLDYVDSLLEWIRSGPEVPTTDGPVPHETIMAHYRKAVAEGGGFGSADGPETQCERLKRLRKLIPDLPAKTKIADAVWEMYERGLKRLEIRHAKRIAAETGATLDWLFNGEEAGMPAGLLRKINDQE